MVKNNKHKKPTFWRELVLVLCALYFAICLSTISVRVNDFNKNVDQTIVENFRNMSPVHRQFADLYKMCATTITKNVEANCINIATTALKDEPNIKTIITEFYNLKIPSITEELSVLGWFNPLEVYQALVSKSHS